MTLPRFLARIAAAVGGYFWLPCPRCGRMFAGFEVGDLSAALPVPGRPGVSQTVCRWCAP